VAETRRRRDLSTKIDTTRRDERMAMLSNLDLIRRVPLFSMLTNDQAQSIADSVVKRRFRRGEIIVEHNKKSNALFIQAQQKPGSVAFLRRATRHLVQPDTPDAGSDLLHIAETSVFTPSLVPSRCDLQR